MMHSRTFADDVASVKQARRFVADAVAGIATDTADAAILMVSELATNAVRHARHGFMVTVDLGVDRLRVVVADSGPGAPALRSPAPTDPHGRGLQIVTELADDWGFSSSPDTGTSVWFSIRLDGERSDAERAADDQRRESAATGPN